jgi:hypothetical protein
LFFEVKYKKGLAMPVTSITKWNNRSSVGEKNTSQDSTYGNTTSFYVNTTGYAQGQVITYRISGSVDSSDIKQRDTHFV